jgi:hypothetical protein
MNVDRQVVPTLEWIEQLTASRPEMEPIGQSGPDGHVESKKDTKFVLHTTRIAACGSGGAAATRARWHYAANRDLVPLMELGGWQSEKMVLRYAHVHVGHLAQSIAALPCKKAEHVIRRPHEASQAAARVP